MVPYTTPYHKFELPVTFDLVEKLYITYAANGELLFEKTLEDCEFVAENIIEVHLTQADTGTIKNGTKVIEVQITFLTTDRERATSNILRLPADKILKSEEI